MIDETRPEEPRWPEGAGVLVAFAISLVFWAGLAMLVL